MNVRARNSLNIFFNSDAEETNSSNADLWAPEIKREECFIRENETF